ncbi:MAG: hypothetical protein HOV79_00170 [Hamadaea sp.]|nr:hypothetical protein [Hamadaea sp.]
MTPKAGDILHVTREASVQFATAIFFRVIRVHDWPTYDGWLWLDGYQLNAAGDAVERRSIFVQGNGLRMVKQSPAPAGNAGTAGFGPATQRAHGRTSLQDRAVGGRAGARRTPAIATG